MLRRITRWITDRLEQVGRIPEHYEGCWLILLAAPDGLDELARGLLMGATRVNGPLILDKGEADTKAWGREPTLVVTSPSGQPGRTWLRKTLDHLDQKCAMLVAPDGTTRCSESPDTPFAHARWTRRKPRRDHTRIAYPYSTGNVYLSIEHGNCAECHKAAQAPNVTQPGIVSTGSARHGAPVVDWPTDPRRTQYHHQLQVQHQHQVPKAAPDPEPVEDPRDDRVKRQPRKVAVHIHHGTDPDETHWVAVTPKKGFGNGRDDQDSVLLAYGLDDAGLNALLKALAD